LQMLLFATAGLQIRQDGGQEGFYSQLPDYKSGRTAGRKAFIRNCRITNPAGRRAGRLLFATAGLQIRQDKSGRTARTARQDGARQDDGIRKID